MDKQRLLVKDYVRIVMDLNALGWTETEVGSRTGYVRQMIHIAKTLHALEWIEIEVSCRDEEVCQIVRTAVGP